MKQLVFIALLMLSGGPASAEWIFVTTSENNYTTYIDPETIHRKGNRVNVWTITDLKLAKHSPVQGQGDFLSTRSLQQFDCEEERTRLLQFTAFSGNMGKGTVVTDFTKEGSWDYLPPNSVGRHVMELACKK